MRGALCVTGGATLGLVDTVVDEADGAPQLNRWRTGTDLRDDGSGVALSNVSFVVLLTAASGTVTRVDTTTVFDGLGWRFDVVSGPCTTRDDGRCVGRPSGYQPNEQCTITVGVGGVLGTSPVFQVRSPSSFVSAPLHV